MLKKKKKLIDKKNTNIALKWKHTREYVFTDGDNGAVYIAKDKEPYIKDGKWQYPKEFSSVNNHDELIKLISQNHNLYEVATTKNNKNVEKRKLYVDVDDFKEQPITTDELDVIINNFMIQINFQLKDNDVKINQDDIIVLLNYDYKENGVKSFHFIVNNLCMDFSQQSKMVKNMNATKKMDYEYDDRIYNRHQQFRMLNQSKINKNETLISYKQLENIKDTFITHTKKCKVVNYNKEIETAIQDTFGKDTFGKDKEHIKLTKKTFSKFIDYVDELWNSSRNWKQITRIIKKYDLMNTDRWNKISIEKATRNYDKHKNNDFINEVDINQVKSGIPTLLNILNKCSNNYYFTMEYDKYEIQKEKLTDYIENYNLPIDINKMNELKPKPILVDDIYEINLKSGMITDKRTEQRINFYDKSITNNDIFKRIDIEHISEIDVNEYIDGDEKFLNIKSDWGTGKSHHILKPIISNINEKSVLIITPINSLNSKLCDDLKQYGFVSHQEAQQDKSINLQDHNKVICSIQSICKLEMKKYDYVFLDEYECIMTNFAGDTFNTYKSALECYRCFVKKCKKAQKVICLDADLDHKRLEILTNAIQYPTQDIKVYHNKQNEYKNYKYILTDDKAQFINDIPAKLNDNKKIVISSASKNFTDVLFETIKDDHPDKNICYISAYGVKLWTDNMMREIKQKNKSAYDEYIQQLENNLIKDNIDVWIYSPTISVGISINAELFDYGFAYGISCSVNALQFLQQLFRARKLKEKTFKIYLDGRCWTGDKNLTYEQIKYNYNIKTTQFIKFNMDYYKIDYKTDEDYLIMYRYAKMIDKNSNISFRYEFVKYLISHDLQYEYENKKGYTELNSTTFLTSAEELKIIKKENFYDNKLLSVSEFKKTQKKIKDNEDVDDDILDRYYKTNSIYHIADIHSLLKDIGDDVIEWNKNHMEQLITSKIDRVVNDNETGILYELCNNIKQFLECRNTYNKYKRIETENNEDNINEEYLIDDANKVENTKRINFIKIIKTIKYDYNNTTITNNDFYNLIENNKALFQDIYNTEIAQFEEDKKFIMWLEKYKNKKTQTQNDKKYIKMIYEVVKDIFKTYDIQVKYISVYNTSKDRDRILIQPYNKIIKYETPLKYTRYIKELYTLDIKMTNFDLKCEFEADVENDKIKIIDKKYFMGEKQVYKTRASRHNTEKNYIDTYRPYKISISKKLEKLKYRNKHNDIKKAFKKVINEIGKCSPQLKRLENNNTCIIDYEIKINKQTYELTNRITEDIDVRNDEFTIPYLQELKTINYIPKITTETDEHYLHYINNYNGIYDFNDDVMYYVGKQKEDYDSDEYDNEDDFL